MKICPKNARMRINWLIKMSKMHVNRQMPLLCVRIFIFSTTYHLFFFFVFVHLKVVKISFENLLAKPLFHYITLLHTHISIFTNTHIHICKMFICILSLTPAVFTPSNSAGVSIAMCVYVSQHINTHTYLYEYVHHCHHWCH